MPRTGRATCSFGAPILLGSSGKGREYFLHHLLGTENGILGGELDGSNKRARALMEKWRPAPEGKLDLLVNMDFRMSTTSIYSDIVLPAATFYEERHQYDGYA